MKPNREHLKAESDEELMAESSRGNRLAFEVLYYRYFDRLVWFAKGFLFDTQKAEDVVQEVFVRLMEYSLRFDREKKFSTWVYTITGNLCKNQIRNEQNRQRILNESKDFDSHVEADPFFQDDAERLKLRMALAKNELNENEKMLLALRFDQELSIKEIAQIQNKPEGTIKSGLYYLLRKMATHLKEFAHGK